jgi:hypothetical protein
MLNGGSPRLLLGTGMPFSSGQIRCRIAHQARRRGPCGPQRQRRRREGGWEGGVSWSISGRGDSEGTHSARRGRPGGAGGQPPPPPQGPQCAGPHQRSCRGRERRSACFARVCARAPAYAMSLVRLLRSHSLQGAMTLMSGLRA